MRLTSATLNAPEDVVEFSAFAAAQGWGDGLPLVAPSVERVERFLDAAGCNPAEVIAELPPLRAMCTYELLAVNGVMAGAPPAALHLMAAAVKAMAEPDFELASLNATTGSVVPAVVVNGEQRHRLSIPFGAGCLGGAGGWAPAIGRALRLTMRHVAGQRIGLTSESVFGQPARVAGLVFGEWEERSPWPPLAERRRTVGDAITVFGAMGTMNICDLQPAEPDEFLELIGVSLASRGANGFIAGPAYSETMIAINPVWAEIIGRKYTNADDVQQLIWEHAQLPIEAWPEHYRPALERAGRIINGRVSLVLEPSQLLVVVCGGLGALHAHALHGWGPSSAITFAVDGPPVS